MAPTSMPQQATTSKPPGRQSSYDLRRGAYGLSSSQTLTVGNLQLLFYCYCVLWEELYRHWYNMRALPYKSVQVCNTLHSIVVAANLR